MAVDGGPGNAKLGGDLRHRAAAFAVRAGHDGSAKAVTITLTQSRACCALCDR
jgi:hypothetical protein